MSLFDWYEPDPPLPCPVCGRPLSRWQGKDGPREMLVWRQGLESPIGLLLDDVDPMLPLDDCETRLPGRFRFRSWDCERHKPIEAEGETEGGEWTRTRLVDPGEEPREAVAASSPLPAGARQPRKAKRGRCT